MIEFTEIDTEVLESMTIYLSDDFRDDKKEMTTYNNPFHWIRKEYTIKGVRSQIASLKIKYKKKEDLYRQELINLMRRTCQWKNGKTQDKRMKEALQIFIYLDNEAEFEAGLE
tara:strand:+ start:3120 stop:3458 length:339 start_codon:yes stop_codon:yes gene_type:complete